MLDSNPLVKSKFNKSTNNNTLTKSFRQDSNNGIVGCIGTEWQFEFVAVSNMKMVKGKGIVLFCGTIMTLVGGGGQARKRDWTESRKLKLLLTRCIQLNKIRLLSDSGIFLIRNLQIAFV